MTKIEASVIIEKTHDNPRSLTERDYLEAWAVMIQHGAHRLPGKSFYGSMAREIIQMRVIDEYGKINAQAIAEIKQHPFAKILN